MTVVSDGATASGCDGGKVMTVSTAVTMAIDVGVDVVIVATVVTITSGDSGDRDARTTVTTHCTH
jgi:hypothetical protein